MALEWKISPSPVDYPESLDFMENRVADIVAGHAPEMVWLLEHPPLYTAGTSAKAGDLLAANRFPVYSAGRGGQYTYHGPGQRIAYVMLDLKRRDAMDVRRYVQSLEQWIIQTLAAFGVESFTREGRVGVWVEQTTDGRRQTAEKNSSSVIHRPSSDFGEAKIAALGIRVRKWVTFHGVSINVNPDLSHYAGIVPCGLGNFGVTSLEKMGVKATMEEVDAELKKQFGNIIADGQ